MTKFNHPRFNNNLIQLYIDVATNYVNDIDIQLFKVENDHNFIQCVADIPKNV